MQKASPKWGGFALSSGAKAILVLFRRQGLGGHALDTRPAIAALDHRHQFIQRGTFALGFQGDAAVPVVGDPSGQAQLLGGALGKVAEPHTLHISREMPAAADHTHASMPVTV